MAKLNILGLVAICVLVVALLFAVLAASLMSWETGEIMGADVKGGLWRFCIGTTCDDIDDADTWFTEDELDSYKTVRAMVILGILLIVAAIACGILPIFVLSSMKVLYLAAAAIGFAAGFCLMVGMGKYVDQLDYPGVDYDAAFAFDIIAWVTAWVGGGLLIGAKMTAKD